VCGPRLLLLEYGRAHVRPHGPANRIRGRSTVAERILSSKSDLTRRFSAVIPVRCSGYRFFYSRPDSRMAATHGGVTRRWSDLKKVSNAPGRGISICGDVTNSSEKSCCATEPRLAWKKPGRGAGKTDHAKFAIERPFRATDADWTPAARCVSAKAKRMRLDARVNFRGWKMVSYYIPYASVRDERVNGVLRWKSWALRILLRADLSIF